MSSERIDQVKSVVDISAYFMVLGALMEALPKIAAGLSIIWLCIQISQSQRFYQLLRALKCMARHLRFPRR